MTASAKSRRKFLCALLFAMLLAGCREMIAGHALLVGKIMNGAEPLRYAKVELEEFSWYRRYSTLTDGDGEFILRDVLLGNITRGRITVTSPSGESYMEYVSLPDTVLIKLEDRTLPETRKDAHRMNLGEIE